MLVFGVISTMVVPLESCTQAIVDSAGRERKMKVLLNTIKVVVGPSHECELKEMVVKLCI